MLLAKDCFAGSISGKGPNTPDVFTLSPNMCNLRPRHEEMVRICRLPAMLYFLLHIARSSTI